MKVLSHHSAILYERLKVKSLMVAKTEKFGKFLEARQLELPEYVGHFINYKQLKKLIKSLAAVPQFNDINNFNQQEIEKTLQDNKTSFFFRLERELEKVNSFYLEKESDLKVRLDILVKKKIDAIAKNRLGSKESIAYITLYDGFKRFARDLDRLEQFVELNQTGFAKVLKKWDKRSKSHTKELYLSKAVSVQPVFNRAEISQLSDLCANSLVELDAKVEGEDVVRFESERRQYITELSNLKLGNSNSANSLIASNLSTNSTSASSGIPIDDFEIDEIYSEFLQVCSSSNVLDLLLPFIKRIKLSLSPALKLTKLFFLSISTKIPDDILEKFYLESSELINLSILDEISQKNIFHELCCNPTQERTFILKLAIEKNLNINTKDISGRFPLHYASELGKHDIIKILATQQDTLANINALDYDSMSPLLLAISQNHFETIQILLELGADPAPTNSEQNPQYLPLNIACKAGNFAVVKLLLGYPKVLNYQRDAEGLLPLHVVAKTGNWQLVELLTSNNADPNQLDGFNKWPPIFYSVSEGHKQTTEKLIKSGAKIDVIDEENFTALFYASWEGHLDVLNVLIQDLHSNTNILSPLKETIKPEEPPSLSLPTFGMDNDIVNFDTIPDLSLPPPIIPLRRYGHNFLEKKIFVQLHFDSGRSTLSLNEGLSSSLPGRIVISSRISDVVPRNLVFPVNDGENIIAFQIDSLNDFEIDFEIFPSFGTKLIAKTSALPNVFTNVTNDGLSNFVTLPLFDGRLKTIGELTFQFQVIYPYSGTPLEISKFDTYWKSTSGNSNNNNTGSNNYQAVQNVLSFVTSSSLSGDYVKINVTLLSDGTPIVCPSWNLPVLNTSISLFQLSSEQLKSLTNYDISNFQLSHSGSSTKVNLQEELQQLLSVSYILLDDFFKIVPELINLDVEVLYPTESEISEIPITLPESTNLNKFVDSILTSVFHHVRESRNNFSSKTSRSIVFSSNNQAVCSILNWKQPNYPVFFNMSGVHFNNDLDIFEESSGNGFPTSIVTKEDPTTRSVKEATRFASLNNLLGIIIPSELLVLIPGLVETIRSRGLILVASNKANRNSEEEANSSLINVKKDINGVRFSDVLRFKGDINM